MKKLILYLILTTIFTSAYSAKNTFIIKDKNGNRVKNRKIKHTLNDFLKEQDMLLKELKKIRKKRYRSSDFNTKRILNNAKKHLGERYVWGGTRPNAFDCSGYTQYLYKKEGVTIPRTAYAQSKVGVEVSPNNLKEGDLLFFLTDKSRGIPVTHVGLYLGNDKFIHAASRKKGIIISSFSKSRYRRIFVKATRIVN